MISRPRLLTLTETRTHVNLLPSVSRLALLLPLYRVLCLTLAQRSSTVREGRTMRHHSYQQGPRETQCAGLPFQPYHWQSIKRQFVSLQNLEPGTAADGHIVTNSGSGQRVAQEYLDANVTERHGDVAPANADGGPGAGTSVIPAVRLVIDCLCFLNRDGPLTACFKYKGKALRHAGDYWYGGALRHPRSLTGTSLVRATIAGTCRQTRSLRRTSSHAGIPCP